MLRRTAFLLIILVFIATTQAQPPIDNIEFLGFNNQNFAHIMDIEVVGSKAYASVGFPQGLETYDISNPFNPSRISTSPPANWRSREERDESVFRL